MGMTYDRDPFKGLCYFVLEGRRPYVRVGKRSRAMDFAILRDGTILGAFATEEDAANYVKRGEQIDRLKAELRATQERLERCEAERDALIKLAGLVLGDFPEYMDLDGFDCQKMCEEAGLLEPHTITKELLDACDPDNCSCREYHGEADAIGETCYRVTELGKRARAALRDT